MSRSKTGARLSSRARKRSFAESVEFPRWILVLGLALIGFVLLLAALSDPAGKLAKPGIGSYLYIVALIAVAAGAGFVDRKRSIAARRIIAEFFAGNLPHRQKRSGAHEGTMKKGFDR